jgi:hypothetical protein
MNRRTAPKVRDGRVQKQNNWARSRDDYYAVRQDEIRLDRRPSGPGFRHLITIAQLRRMIELLPDWSEAAVGVRAVVLDDGGDDVMGWYRPGVVAVCAWERELWWSDADPQFIAEHDTVLDLLDVERVRHGRRVELRWTEDQARAFQLLDVLPHELGHHRDLMTTRSRRRVARGESYAESYAQRTFAEVWPAYAREFGL